MLQLCRGGVSFLSVSADVCAYSCPALRCSFASPSAASACLLEVLVVDGGSTDRTVSRAAAAGATVGCRCCYGNQHTTALQFLRVQVLTAAKGRGTQMNAGAKAAAGSALLFMHADCTPTPKCGPLTQLEALACMRPLSLSWVACPGRSRRSSRMCSSGAARRTAAGAALRACRSMCACCCTLPH